MRFHHGARQRPHDSDLNTAKAALPCTFYRAHDERVCHVLFRAHGKKSGGDRDGRQMAHNCHVLSAALGKEKKRK
jgi:hypothetical protein